uniref:Peptidoglycan recognition protein 2 n=1 Tax=Varanus komodoensis TaxID=61221 RepID=A0A8D2LL01_VARKO
MIVTLLLLMSVTFHMDAVMRILEDLESCLKGTPAVSVAVLLQELEACTSEMCQFFLGPMAPAPSDLACLSEAQRAFLKSLVNQPVSNDSLIEHGVVLTADGTTVVLAPLLAGVAAGLRRRREVAHPATALRTDPSASSEVEPHLLLDHLSGSTIAVNLAMAFLLFYKKQSPVALGPNGCWDHLSHAQPPPNISALLNTYYSGEDLVGGKQLRSNFRRQSFAVLVSKEELSKQVENSLHLLRRLNETHTLFEGITNEELTVLANQAAEEFTALYVECPAIIPRCMWGARPYNGTPTQLQLPLGFVYIHHTSTPSKPCRTFPACSADMRSMQRFHQDVRGWDDIGYSFVFGSDGYLYQGRGWHWVGAHTRGYNSKGYGVSFIGNYMEVLPEPFDLELMKNSFLQCAVRGSRLQANYTIHGHRQMTSTLCPGDRLFQEIKTWKGFKERCFMDRGVQDCT